IHGARRGRARAALDEIPLGRRERCSALPRVCGDHDCRRILKRTWGQAASLSRPRGTRSCQMIHIPVLRWGEPYKSLDVDKVVHFATGETVCEASRANPALVGRDMRFAQRARDVLREVPIRDLLGMIKKAADLYTDGELPLGDGSQTPDQFVRMQSATT